MKFSFVFLILIAFTGPILAFSTGDPVNDLQKYRPVVAVLLENDFMRSTGSIITPDRVLTVFLAGQESKYVLAGVLNTKEPFPPTSQKRKVASSYVHPKVQVEFLVLELPFVLSFHVHIIVFGDEPGRIGDECLVAGFNMDFYAPVKNHGILHDGKYQLVSPELCETTEDFLCAESPANMLIEKYNLGAPLMGTNTSYVFSLLGILSKSMYDDKPRSKFIDVLKIQSWLYKHTHNVTQPASRSKHNKVYKNNGKAAIRVHSIAGLSIVFKSFFLN